MILVSARVASGPRVGILNCFGYETMSNCSQNCWIDLNSAALCFKRLFHIGMNVNPIFEASLSHHTLCIMGTFWSGFNNRVYMYHVFH